MGLMSHIREASNVTINISYFHPAHQHYTDEAQNTETVVRYSSMAFRATTKKRYSDTTIQEPEPGTGTWNRA